MLDWNCALIACELVSGTVVLCKVTVEYVVEVLLAFYQKEER
jgi:hypothetical protein